MDQTKLRRTSWDVSAAGTDIGGVDEVDPSGIKLEKDPVRVGTAGKIKLDDRVIGIQDGSVVKIQFRETATWAKMKLMFPWLGAGTDLVPPTGALMTAYAVQWILHPHDKPADTSEDIVLYKAVPRQGYAIKRDGTKDDVFEVELEPYPDPTKVGTSANPYGKIGAP